MMYTNNTLFIKYLVFIFYNLFVLIRLLNTCFFFQLVFSSDWEDEYELENRAQSGSYAGNNHGRIPVMLVTVFSLVRNKKMTSSYYIYIYWECINH